MLNKDEIKGKAKQVKGAIKENLGWVTDDHEAEDEGKAERAEGKSQENDAKVRQEIEENEEEDESAPDSRFARKSDSDNQTNQKPRRNAMEVKDIMTKNPACCTPDTNLQEVARLMVEHDCGESPVVESKQSMKLVGVITDRDITCRTVAKGKNPLEMTAGDCMSSPCVTVTPEMSMEDCCQVMEENKVRRVPVVDENGACCGIVAQADIAQYASKKETATVVKAVSMPNSASHVAAG